MTELVTWSTSFRSINILHICYSDPSELKHNFYTILIHGWMGRSADLHSMGNNLSKLMRCHVMIPDLPFHNSSLKASPSTPSEASQLVLDAINNEIDQELPAKINIIGYSLGGRIAIEIANIHFKDLTRHKNNLKLNTLLLISSAPPPLSIHKSNRTELKYPIDYAQRCIDASNRTADELLQISSKEQFSEWLMNSWYLKPMWGRLRYCSNFVDFLKGRVGAYSKTQRDAWAQASNKLSRGLMSKIDVKTTNEMGNLPVLYIYGDLDLKYKSFVQEFRLLFSRLQSHCVASSGHNVLIEQGDRVGKEVVTFILCQSPESRFEKLWNRRSFITISHMSLEPYSLAMRSPMSIRGHAVGKREGLLLRLHVNNQIVGIGDICPLPGLHKETVQDCKEQLEGKLTPEFLSACSKQCMSNCEVPILSSLSDGLFNSARTGFECALIHVLSLTRNEPVSETLLHLFAKSLNINILDSKDHIFVNGVYPRTLKGQLSHDSSSDRNEVANQAPEMRWFNEVKQSKFHTLKLKVGGSSSVNDDAKMALCAARACKKAGKSLRLDANRAWSVDDYMKFSKILNDNSTISHLEYIEEPVQNNEDLKYILEKCGSENMLPVALDETVEYFLENHDLFFNSFKEMVRNSVAIVVKPALFGSTGFICELMRILMDCSESGTSSCQNQSSTCKQHVKRLIISSVFESGVGIAWNSIIASTCDSILSKHYRNMSNQLDEHESYPNQCHGLGTMPYIIGDSCQPSFESQCVVYEHECGSKVIVERCNQLLNNVAK